MKKQIGVVLTVLMVALSVGVVSYPASATGENVDERLAPYQKVLDKLNAEHLTEYPLVIPANSKLQACENISGITPEKYEALLRAEADRERNASQLGLIVTVPKEKLAPYQAVVDKLNQEYHLSLYIPTKTYNGDKIETVLAKTPDEFETELRAAAKIVDPNGGPADIVRLLSGEAFQGPKSRGGVNALGDLLLLEAEGGMTPQNAELIGQIP